MKIPLLKKENNFKKKNFIFNPDIYWEFAVFISLIMIILSFLFSYRLFMQTNQESSLPVTKSSGQIPTVDESRLEKDLDYFSAREQKSAEILNSPAPIVDPSL